MLWGNETMQKTVTVPNMSCGHCKMRIEKALNGLEGVSSAEADVSTKAITLEWDESTLQWENIRAALEKIDYPPEV